jgi:hypothetical protein
MLFVLFCVYAALNDVLFNVYSKPGYRYKTDQRWGRVFYNITLGRAANIMCFKLALALLTVPMQLRRFIKTHASKAFVFSFYSNAICFGSTGNDQVYKL